MSKDSQAGGGGSFAHQRTLLHTEVAPLTPVCLLGRLLPAVHVGFLLGPRLPT